MKPTVWKYPITLAASDRFSLDLPSGAKILTLQMQQGVPTLWALVDPEKPPTPRLFMWLGTGHQSYSARESGYVGTVQMYQDSLVLHLFELIEGIDA